jgi:uncharacterized protein YdhG (YjbR/CyaY superfamily)
MQSRATTVEAYLAELPPDRRATISTVRDTLRKNLAPGFEEGMQYGMIGYFIPHATYPAGYHCDPKQPLPFVCLASQKNYCSLYAMSLYADGPQYDAFVAAWKKTGKKLDMGKSCIRFKTADDLPLDVIGQALKPMTVAKWIAIYETSLKDSRKRPSKAVKKAVKKKVASKRATRRDTEKGSAK